MAIVVEDGTGKADAETYIGVTDADAYHAARANTSWAALTTPNKEAYLRRAAEYMVQVYRMRWKGTRVKSTQALDWPRAWVIREDFYNTSLTPPDSVDGNFYYPSDEVPTEVVRACAELALKAAAGELAPDLDRPTLSETVGPISVTYAAGSREVVKYRAIDNLLAPLLSGDGNSLKVVRA
jgi:DnaT-like ssDNA binding protein